ncbi:MAG: amino acid adenylation domain-containing protein [Mycobacteriales bacterium]
MHELFERQVARAPEATALVFAGRRLDYGTLNAAANALARRLLELGVRPGSLVGIYLDRGPELVAAVLAVLKAGGGYALLDTDSPDTRLRRELDQIHASVVVTDRRRAPGLAAVGAELTLVHADGCLDSPVTADVAGGARPDDVACVMFTSGSTGTPKGIASPHRGIVATLLGGGFGDLGPAEVMLQEAPISWDMFAYELFGALLFGATCVLQPGQRPEPALIAALVREHRVSILYAAASLLNFLVDEHLDIFAGVRQVLTGGETMSPAHAARLLDRHPHLRLLNGYGPVEAMMLSTAHEVSRADTAGPTVPIGRAVPHKRVYVLDGSLRPVPEDVTGELYAAGAGLADGYLNQAGLTSTRFVADPFGAPGERMYRTGDLARWRAGGTLEFLGRVDDQVKVRGFRIELGGVERVLASHPAVRRAAVVVREDSPGDRRLVGYAVARPDTSPARLREHLAGHLPEYSVPAAVVLVDALPLTANGKLDRRALPAPDYGAAPTGEGPRTGRERLLCEMFADLLGVGPIGIDGDFFDLGGHSLLAARLVGRVRTAYGVELSLRELFDHPTPRELARHLDEVPSGATPALRARPRTGRVPLSFAQRRLWFLDTLESTGAAYHVPHAVRLRGDLDQAALWQAVREVMLRHEALRTVFPVVDGEPEQRVLDPERVVVRPRVFAADGPELPGAVARIAAEPFDLATQPPLRAALGVLGPRDFVLVLVLHHIACDGWSLAPLLRDLGTAYAARVAGGEPRWTDLPVQYADYALWQRAALGDLADPGSRFSRQLAYWTDTLAGVPDEVELLPDRPRPPVPSRAGAAVPVELDGAVHGRLVELAKARHVTLFMVLHAALAALLTRLGAGTDIPIGSPVAGRADEALDDLVGFFVNTLVLRTDTSGDPTFADLLARVRETDLAAYGNQDVPFERLVEVLNPARSPSRHPLFQIMLVVQNNAEARLELPGLSASVEPVSTGTAKFDLTVELRERYDPTGAPGGVTGTVRYATDLYDEATARALTERLVRLLTAVAAAPDRPIGEIDLLSPGERWQLLAGWNGAPARHPDSCLHELVERQAAATPDTTAVVSGGRRLSYARLDTRAGRLADHLAARGVGPGSVVAVALPRRPELVVALLAVLKAGGAYLPVDLDDPAERIAFVLADAGASVVLTDQPGRVPAPAGVPVLTLPGPAGPTDPPGPAPAARRATPADRAYVIYTSGSTGRPKGVAVPHAAIVNTLGWLRERYGLRADDVMLHKAAAGFDASVREIFLPLVTGATLVLAEPGGQRDPAYLARLIQAERITTVGFVPSMLWAFLAEESARGCRSLRRIVCGGEPYPRELWRRCAGTLDVAQYNLYGPTETAVDVTAWRAALPPEAATVPIGRPGAGVAVRLLDAGLRPVPVGTAGELYVAGVQLAEGYLNRPGLTAERFVADPFGGPGERMYRTGDLARWRAGGTLEFLGRVDDQLKVRGFRLEPGEVESVLAGHPAVSRAAVVVREDRPGDSRLVGYVVGSGPDPVDLAGLRRHAARLLPDHMVPAVLTELDELPVTGNGKLDRAALPAPRPAAATAGRRPRTRTEEVLCGLFGQLLGVPGVGIDDNFFDLGGHSLLATRLISHVRSALGAELTMTVLFEHPTVAGVAERLTRNQYAHTAPRPALRSRTRPREAS